MRFRAEILQAGKTATGIEVPEAVMVGLGAGKRPPATVTINGYTYGNTVAPMGGASMVAVSADVRQKAGIKGGDVVDVEIELDTEPREVTAPPDLAEALDRDADARRSFDGLSYSNRRRIVASIEDARTAETRQRRIDKTISTLREGSV